MDQQSVKSQMNLHFDAKSDVLYCSFGEPQPAIGVEVDEGIVVRHHPETDAVVGITVVDFLRRFQQQSATVSIPLDNAVYAEVYK